MDELDLVRLARPSAPVLDDDELAAIKARAFSFVDDAPASDAPPTDVMPVVELHYGPAMLRRSRTPALLAAAATVVLIAGGLALGARHRDRQDRSSVIAGVVDGGPDAELQRKLVGGWDLAALALGSTGYLGPQRDPATGTTAPSAAALGFNGDGGGVALTTQWCGMVVSSGYRVQDGRLVLADSLSGIEGGCAQPAGAQSHRGLVALLEGRPAVSIGGNVLTLTGANGNRASFARMSGTASSEAPLPAVPSTAATTSAAAAPKPVVPTLTELDGRTFDIVRIVVDGAEQSVVGSVSMVVTGTVFGATGCNLGGGEARIEDGHLVVDSFGLTRKFCSEGEARQEDTLRTIVTSRPSISLDGNVLTLTAGASVLEARLHFDKVHGTPSTSPATTIGQPTAPSLERFVPTLTQLEGKTYDVVRIVVDGVERSIVGAASVGVYTTVYATAHMTIFFVGTECNGGGGDARIEEGRLIIDSLGSRSMGCREDLMRQDDVLSQIVTSHPSIAQQGDVLMLTSGTSTIEARLRPRPSVPATTRSATTAVTIVDQSRVSGPDLGQTLPAPDLGSLTSADELIAALLANEPLDNLTAAAVAQQRSPAQSICIDIIANREPAAGTAVHEAVATYAGEHGVVVVLQRADGTRQVRAYSTSEPDETGGCRLLVRTELP
jgi:heat shock protein HslJ